MRLKTSSVYVMSWLLSKLLPLCVITQVFSQQSGDLRIIGDVDRRMGRLEIYLRGQWGTICIEGFTQESADTACRQLGRARALTFIEATRIGLSEGTGPIHLYNVRCRDDDVLLARCTYLDADNNVCSHAQDVAVSCSSDSYHYEGAVRLVDGPYTSEGILQLYLSGRWGTICSTSAFPIVAANIICSQLGYAESFGSMSVSNRRTDSPVWLTLVNSCKAGSSCFAGCYSVQSPPVDLSSSCDHTSDVYISCATFSTQQSGGTTPQCMSNDNNNSGDDGNEGSSTGTIIGLSLGLGIPALIFIIFILFKTGKLKEWKESCCECTNSTRHRITSHHTRSTAHVTLQSHTRETENLFNTEPAATSEYDSSKPPAYDDALTYRKTVPGDDEGYPEPSLVDEVSPPSYDTVN